MHASRESVATILGCTLSLFTKTRHKWGFLLSNGTGMLHKRTNNTIREWKGMNDNLFVCVLDRMLASHFRVKIKNKDKLGKNLPRIRLPCLRACVFSKCTRDYHVDGCLQSDNLCLFHFNEYLTYGYGKEYLFLN